jgi:hypothetical protein
MKTMESGYKYVDISFIQNLTSGDIVVIKEIISLFRMEVPLYIADLKKSYDEKQWDNLAAVAHKAKSSFALMGIQEVVADLKSLEIQAKDKQITDIFPAIISNVETIYNLAIKELEAFATR